jgi:hypothetical protein
MPHLTRDQLAVRRATRRHRDRLRHRRLLLAIGASLLSVGLVALALVLSSGAGPTSGINGESVAGPVAPPVAGPPQRAARPASAVVLATVAGLELRMPVDPVKTTAIVFRAVDDPMVVALDPAGDIGSDVAPSDGVDGPTTGSVDVGAAAGTAVVSPVDGTVASVAPYTVAGRPEGYQVAITPADASGVVVEINHLDPPVGGTTPTVGSPVRAGVGPAIGQVRDFSKVAVQELAKYTSDSGNHVHLEVVRTGSDLLP